MPAPALELFEQTLEVMNPGDCLLVTGGSFPGQGETADIKLDLGHIFQFMGVFYDGLGDRAKSAEHPMRHNPLGARYGTVELPLSRSEQRFRFDIGQEWFRYGKKIAAIGEHTVDLVLVGDGGLDFDFCFVSKLREDRPKRVRPTEPVSRVALEPVDW